MSLSVTVIMRDEASNIGRCLESVRWADEIVVIDGGSDDDSGSSASSGSSEIESPWLRSLRSASQ